MSKVLIVEDELHIAAGLRFNLEAEGHACDIAETGEGALHAVENGTFDLIVLDVMLPGMNGFEVAAELRRRGQFVPILMLTARNRPEDVLHGFETGADDYLPKPFELPILLARIRGLLRRHEWIKMAHAGASGPETAEPEPLGEFDFAGKRIDFTTLELRMGDRVVPLTLMEANLLRYLVRHRDRPVSRKAMLEEVWGVREDTDTRAIDNFIVRLRRYIEDDPSKPKYLVTVRGVGYKFVPQP